MARRPNAKPVKGWARKEAKGRYFLEITPTFSAEKDPFALQLDENDASNALLLMLGGKVILKVDDTLDAGEKIRIDPVPGLKVGINEFYLEANPAEEVVSLSHAIRVRVLHIREGDLVETAEVMVDTTLWSEPGARVAETFELTLKAKKDKKETKKDGHSHEH